MNELPLELADALEFQANSTFKAISRQCIFKLGAKVALTNPDIYTKANLIHMNRVQPLLDALQEVIDIWESQVATNALNNFNKSK
jgi:hypothetical protein